VRKEAALALGVIAPAEAETALLTALPTATKTCATSRPTRSATSAPPQIQAIETRLAAETSPVVRSALLAAKNKLDRAASR
jgi:hypothetical protein